MLLAVLLGGAVGTALRLAIDAALPHDDASFPLSTLIINCVGAFLLGALVSRVWESAPEWLKAALGPGLLGSLYDVDAWATVDEIERQGRTRRTAIAAVGAGSVGAAVLGLVAFTGPPAGLGERPPTRQAPASVTADLAGVGASLGPATGILRRHAR